MRYKYTERRKFEVVLLRSRGRFVKSIETNSLYSAKQVVKKWDKKYDKTYDIEIRPVDRIVVSR